jgi:tetratricopeptide (TPR) repeat protein
MRKRIALLLTLPVVFSGMILTAGMQDLDQSWQGRQNLKPENAGELTAGYEDMIAKEPQNYRLLWMYSRALNFCGMYLTSDNESKKKLFQKAKDVSLNATQLSPDSPEGHIWLAVSLGNWGEANGVLKSLSVVPDIERNMNEVLTKDPESEEAVAYRVLGRLYFKAPGPPLSVGNLDKSELYLKKACDIAPANKKNYYYLADVLVRKNRKPEAIVIIDKALALPIRPEWKLDELADVKDLTELRSRIEEKPSK